jgi:hypothetical protein
MPQSYSPVYFPQDWSAVSMSAANQFEDSCSDDASNDIGNFATLSPIDQVQGASVLSNGNLTIVGSGSNHSSTRSTLQTDGSGKFAWEVTVTTHDTNTVIGLMKSSDRTSGGDNIGATANSGWALVNDPGSTTNARSRFAGSDMVTDLGFQLTNGDVFHFELDNSTGDVFAWRKPSGGSFATVNSGNTITAGAGKTALAGTPVLFAQHTYQAAATNSQTYNFGQTTFEQTPSSGYKAVNTANLAAPTVTKPDDFFNTLLYTGNGGTLAVTGAGFQPDFVWLKCRSVATNWNVVDVVRGADAMLRMASSTNTEQSGANQEFESFDSDGFTVIHHGGVVEELNRSGATYVGYCMKAGGSPSSNVQGNVTSSVSAASHGGFSIGTFTTGTTGAITIGHGLSRAPGMIIVKDRVSTGQYWTFLESQGAGKYLTLNTTDAPASSTAVWNNTDPTATVFSTQDNGAWLTANNSHVFYAFAKTPGLIGMGTYTGNGSADGAFIQVDDGASGFKPAWVMVKRLEAGYAWHIQDAVRSPYNPTALGLNANDTGTDSASTAYDFIANGFKLRTTDGGYNGSASYMYLAFAEDPFGGDGVAQARAR